MQKLWKCYVSHRSEIDRDEIFFFSNYEITDPIRGFSSDDGSILSVL